MIVSLLFEELILELAGLACPLQEALLIEKLHVLIGEIVLSHSRILRMVVLIINLSPLTPLLHPKVLPHSVVFLGEK